MVYEELADYVGDLALVSYDLQYHLDRVLLPEWRRLRIDPIGARGFCVLELARRLLDPFPAGDYKLRTLQEYYRLPRGDTDSGLQDLETVVELLGQVLQPLADLRGLYSWQNVCDFINLEWYPPRIGFGKYKGRLFRDAETDSGLREWLVALSQSPNERNAAVGVWYLGRLIEMAQSETARSSEQPVVPVGGVRGASQLGLVVHVDPKTEELKQAIAAARTRLAELEARYMNDRSRVESVQWRLYGLLRDKYRLRDTLGRWVEYLRLYVEALRERGEEEAEEVAREHEESQAELGDDYESLDREAEQRTEPTPEQEDEVKEVWRKLVKTYHPDRYSGEPEKQEQYNSLMQSINQARDEGDIDTLHEIANDPQGFCYRQGWGYLDVEEQEETDLLERLYGELQTRIVIRIESLNTLHEGPAYEMCQRVEASPELLDEVAAEHGAVLDQEIAALQVESERLKAEIEELTGEPCAVVL